MAKVKQDFNSIENQEIKRKFVEREVYTCFSYEMEAILRASSEQSQYKKDYPLLSYDDIENFYEDKCQNCGSDDIVDGVCKDCKSEEVENEPKEVYEWWIVSSYLAEKLKEENQAIAEWGNNFYWGRETTGQAILLDGVISRICNKMEILHGQKYDWSK